MKIQECFYELLCLEVRLGIDIFIAGITNKFIDKLLPSKFQRLFADDYSMQIYAQK